MPIAVQVVSDSKLAQQDLAKLRGAVDKISNSVNTTTSSLKSLTLGLGAGLVSTGALLSLTRLSDTITTINSRIAVATTSQIAANKAFEETTRIALATRNSLSDVSTLYAKISMSASELGATQKQVATVTQNISRAISLSGASTQEATAAVTQLGQALASGRLQGDELRSILENAPILAQQIAEGLGKTTSEMRMLGAEGRLTSKEVFDALIKQTEKINSLAGKTGITFGSAFKNMGNAGVVLAAGVQKYLEAASGNGPTLASRINDAAVSLAKLGSNFDQVILDMRVGIWKVVLDAEQGFGRIGSSTKKAFASASTEMQESIGDAGSIIKAKLSGFKIMGFTFSLDTSKINIANFIPKLEPMKAMVLKWVTTIERAFFWLYDQVIGHSWIPDLVKGIIKWMGKLTGLPMDSALKFVNTVETAFHNMLDNIMGIPFIDKLIKKLGEARNAVESLQAVRNIRQSLGMRDVVGGIYPARDSSTGYRKYNTDEGVGRGPWARESLRPPLHDLTNSFKPENQIPFLAAIGTTVGAGLITAVASGSFIKGIGAAMAAGLVTALAGSYDRLLPVGIFIGGGILASLSGGTGVKLIAAAITTAFGLATGKIVSDKEGKITTGEIAGAFVRGTKSAVEVLFGSGIFGDKGFGGTLALLAKMALLFAKGREIIGNAALAVAKSPTTLVDNLFDRNSLRLANKALAKNINAVKDLSETIKASLASANHAVDSAKRTMSLATSNAARSAAAPKLASAYQALDAARLLQDNSAAILAKNAKEREALEKNQATLATRVSEASDRLKKGIISAGAGIGAIFGTMGGFDIGTKIAAKMVGYSEWAKVGVTMASAFISQGVGAVIGTAMGTAFAFVVSQIPLIALGAVIVGAIWAALNWDEVSVIISDAWKQVEPILVAAWAKFTPILDKFIVDLKSTLTQFITDAKNIFKSKAQEVAPDLTKRVSNIVDRTSLDASGWTTPFTFAKILADEITGYRSDFKKGEIGHEAIDTGFTFKSDPFIAGQVAAAQATVTEAERAKNLAALKGITDTFTGAATFIRDTLKGIFTDKPNPERPKAFATGGYVSGAGGPRDDKIPAMLSNGEFVVNAAATKQNRGLLEQVNSSNYSNEGRSKPSVYAATESQIVAMNTDIAKKMAKLNSGNIFTTSIDGPPLDNNGTFGVDPGLLFGGLFNGATISTHLPSVDRSAFALEDYAVVLHEIGHAESLKHRLINVVKKQLPIDKFKALQNEELVKRADATLRGLPVIAPSHPIFNSLSREYSIGQQGKLSEEFSASYYAMGNSIYKGDPDKSLIISNILRSAYQTYVANSAGTIRSMYRVFGNDLSSDFVEMAWLNPAYDNSKIGDWLDDGLFNKSTKNSGKLEPVNSDPKVKMLLPRSFYQNSEVLQSLKNNRFATGGSVAGSGTGTSDSILAWLSNGEFVVNAKAAESNKALLESINSGKQPRFSSGGSVGVPRFSSGGAVSGDGSLVVRMPQLDAVVEAVNRPTRSDIRIPEGDIDKLVAAIRSTEGTKEGVVSFKGATGVMQIIEKTFNGVVKQHGMVGKSYSNAADRIEVATIHIKDLWEQYKDPRKVFAVYNAGPDAVSKTGDLVNLFTKRKDGSVFDSSNNYVDKAMAHYSKVGGTAAPTTGAKIGKAIATGFDDLQVEFKKFSEDPRGYLEQKAVSAGIMRPEVYGPPEQTKDEVLKASLLSSQLDGMYEASDTLGAINNAFTAIGQNAISASQYDQIPPDTLDDIVRNFDNIALFSDKLTQNLSDYTRKGTEARIKELKARNAQLNDRILSELADTGQSTRRATEDAKRYGYEFTNGVRDGFGKALGAGLRGDKVAFKSFFSTILTKISDGIVDGLAKGFTDQFFKMSGLDKALAGVVTDTMFLGEQIGADAGGLIKSGLTSLYDKGAAYFTPEVSKVTDKMLSAVGVPSVTGAGASGGSLDLGFNISEPLAKMTTELSSSFLASTERGSALTVDGLDGSFKGLFKMLSGAFGFLQDFMIGGDIKGPSAFGAILKIGTAIAGSFGGLSGANTSTVGMDGLTTAAGVPSVSSSNTFGQMPSSTGSLNTGYDLGSGLDFSGATFKLDSTKLQFNAAGGSIRGPGTGTSDSIPSMLSNGEFVVRAKQASKFGPLLQAINSGSIAAYASGGFVGNNVSSSVIVQAAERRNEEMGFSSSKQKSESVFNINITGDVSRQTKNEIQKLIPLIASGVNQHNYESGYK